MLQHIHLKADYDSLFLCSFSSFPYIHICSYKYAYECVYAARISVQIYQHLNSIYIDVFYIHIYIRLRLVSCEHNLLGEGCTKRIPLVHPFPLPLRDTRWYPGAANSGGSWERVVVLISQVASRILFGYVINV